MALRMMAGATRAAMPSMAERRIVPSEARGSRGKFLRLATTRLKVISEMPMRMPGMMPARNSRATDVLERKA